MPNIHKNVYNPRKHVETFTAALYKQHKPKVFSLCEKKIGTISKLSLVTFKKFYEHNIQLTRMEKKN